MAHVHFLHTPARPALGGTASDVPGPGARLLAAWRAWRTQRRLAGAARHLLTMDDHMLRDIGLSRAQAAFMASRPLLRPWWRDRA